MANADISDYERQGLFLFAWLTESLLSQKGGVQKCLTKYKSQAVGLCVCSYVGACGKVPLGIGPRRGAADVRKTSEEAGCV